MRGELGNDGTEQSSLECIIGAAGLRRRGAGVWRQGGSVVEGCRGVGLMDDEEQVDGRWQ